MLPDNEIFAQYLSSELQLTSALHQLLEQELAALSDNQLESLSSLQQEKSQQLQQLQQQANKRLQWMTEQQLPHSSTCLERPDLAADANITSLWQQLADSYKANQHTSAILTELVLTARHRTQQQLNILHGKQNDPHLYNANGKTNGVSQGQGYIQA